MKTPLRRWLQALRESPFCARQPKRNRLVRQPVRADEFVVTGTIKIVRPGNVPIFLRERLHCAANQFSLLVAYQLFLRRIHCSECAFAHIVDGYGVHSLRALPVERPISRNLCQPASEFRSVFILRQTAVDIEKGVLNNLLGIVGIVYDLDDNPINESIICSHQFGKSLLVARFRARNECVILSHNSLSLLHTLYNTVFRFFLAVFSAGVCESRSMSSCHPIINRTKHRRQNERTSNRPKPVPIKTSAPISNQASVYA